MSVTITHPSIQSRTITIKATPSTPLKQLVNDAVQKWSLGSPENFGLKHGKATLDLSLNIRFANLAQGAKLQLIHVKALPTGLVTIALQTPDGTRLVDKFTAETSLWEILRAFEAKDGNINLTRRTGVEEKGMLKMKKEVYMMPVCVLMNKEFGSIDELKTTTLQKTGLTSGNGVIRVLLRNTDRSPEDVQRELDADSGVNQMQQIADVQILSAGNNQATAFSPPISGGPVAPSVVPIAEPVLGTTVATSLIPIVEPASITAAPTPVPMDLDTPLSSARVSDSGSRSVTATPPLPMDVEPNLAPSAMDVKMETTLAPTVNPNSISTLAPPTDSAYISSATNAGGLVTTTANEGSPQEFQRDIRVYRPPPEGIPYNQITLPDSFYDLSAAELKAVLRSSGSATSTDAPLMTKAMRDREASLRRQKYPKTMIRVRFPNRVTFQATFLSSEKVQALYELVRGALHTGNRPFTLYLTPPMRILDPQQSYWEASLAPATLVYMKWADGETLPGDNYLHEQHLIAMEDFPLPDTNVAPQGRIAGVEVSEEKGESKRPKWLQHVGGMRLGGSSAGNSGNPSRQFGDDRDADTRGARPATAGDGGTDKKPKWFKIGISAMYHKVALL